MARFELRVDRVPLTPGSVAVLAPSQVCRAPVGDLLPVRLLLGPSVGLGSCVAVPRPGRIPAGSAVSSFLTRVTLSEFAAQVWKVWGHRLLTCYLFPTVFISVATFFTLRRSVGLLSEPAVRSACSRGRAAPGSLLASAAPPVLLSWVLRSLSVVCLCARSAFVRMPVALSSACPYEGDLGGAPQPGPCPASPAPHLLPPGRRGCPPSFCSRALSVQFSFAVLHLSSYPTSGDSESEALGRLSLCTVVSAHSCSQWLPLLYIR